MYKTRQLFYTAVIAFSAASMSGKTLEINSTHNYMGSTDKSSLHTQRSVDLDTTPQTTPLASEQLSPGNTNNKGSTKNSKAHYKSGVILRSALNYVLATLLFFALLIASFFVVSFALAVYLQGQTGVEPIKV